MIRLVQINLPAVVTRLCAVATFVFVIEGSASSVVNANANGVASIGNLPLYFESSADENADGFKFFARSRVSGFYVAPTVAVLTLNRFEAPSSSDGKALQSEQIGGRSARSREVRFEFMDANPRAQVVGVDALSGTANYFLGSDSTEWRTGVPLFSRVRVNNLYPGVNLIYYGNERQLEYDFVIAPGTDPSRVAMRITGTDKMYLDDSGGLVLKLGSETIYQPKPVIYQDIKGTRKIIEGGYKLGRNQTVTFKIADYDRSHSLVIDPVLSYSSYYGGNGLDRAWAVATDINGSIYVAGESMGSLPSSNVTIPQSLRFHGGTTLHGDAFVAKFSNPGSNLVYLAYIGGRSNDVARALAVDADGNAFLTGFTDSQNFPTRNAIFPTISGTSYPGFGAYPVDAFVAELNAAGTELVYSTYLGGEWLDAGFGIAVDGAGNAYVAGYTESTNFPVTTNVFGQLAEYSRNVDGFAVKITPGGSNLFYSMYLGGAKTDVANDVAVTADGFAYVAGYTSSTNFPVIGGAQTNLAGGQDAFVVRLGPEGGIDGTYIGGRLNNRATRIALDTDASFYVVGTTTSDPGFPISPSKLNPGGVYRTDIGSTNWTAENAGLASVTVPALAIDPTDSQKLYAGTWRGLFRSVNGGAQWFRVFAPPDADGLLSDIIAGQVLAIVVYPTDPTIVYAGLSAGGVFRSTDSGLTWTQTRTGLVNQAVNALAISSTNLYAGTAAGIYKSTDNAASWKSATSGLGTAVVLALAVDPTNPAIIYAGTAQGMYRSLNDAGNWSTFTNGLTRLRVQALAIDPVNATLYAGTAGGGVFKRASDATSWSSASFGLAGTNTVFTNINVAALAIDPGNPSTIYAGTTRGVFRSLDAGDNWTAISNGLPLQTALSLAINSESVVYAGLKGTAFFGGDDVFVLKAGVSNYSAVFGGSLSDQGADIAVDAVGNAYVVGATASRNFPTRGAYGSLKATNSLGGSDVFITQLDSAGDTLVYSAYLGGSGSDSGNGIAVDPIGNAYIVGETTSSNFPKASPRQSSYRGNRDAFIAKVLSGTPTLTQSLVGSDVVLSWSAFASEFVLQSNTSLTNAAGWVNVAAPTVFANGMQTVTLPATESALFFRLQFVSP